MDAMACPSCRRATISLMKTTTFASITALALASLPGAAIAASLSNPIVPTSCNQAGGCSSVCDIVTLAQNVLNAGIFLAVILSSVMFVYAGARMVMAKGNSNLITSAKKLFWNVLIGIVILLSAWIIVDVLMRSLTGNASWSKLCSTTAIAELPPLA